jgi:hypothetical protein
MKFWTNFSYSYERFIPGLIGLGWGIGMLGLLYVFCLVFSALHFWRENPGLKTTLENLQKNPIVIPAMSSLPSPKDLEDLSRHLNELNSLGGSGGPSVSSILSRLENLLPVGARLLSFQNDQTTGEIQLVVEAGNLDELSKFLASLENASGFSKVTLTKQTQAADGQGNWIQFSVEMVGGVE